MSIPKIIHYCWFGRGEKNELAKNCIASWRKYCPDYKIKEWNEDNFDIHSNLYVKQAYEARKFAFVSDYVRLFALYHEGGVYMDTDVEVIKSIDEFLKHHAFSCFENNNRISTAIVAAEKGNPWIGDFLSEYTDLTFIKENGKMDLTTNVERITKFSAEKYGLALESSYQELGGGAVTLYPIDYFSPKDWETGNINLTENSCTIHHFSGSWHGEKEKKEAEKYKKKLNKYITKYGVEMGNFKYRRHESVKLYLRHPVKALKRLFQNRG